jgi:hypothetical protein
LGGNHTRKGLAENGPFIGKIVRDGNHAADVDDFFWQPDIFGKPALDAVGQTELMLTQIVTSLPAKPTCAANGDGIDSNPVAKGER